MSPEHRVPFRQRRDAVFWSIILFVGGAILLTFNLAPSADIVESEQLTSMWDDCSTECTRVRLQILDVDVTRQIATARVYITPPSKFAYSNSNSSVLDVPMYADLDVSKVTSGDGLQTQVSWNAGDSISTVDLELALTNEAWTGRSFDQYFPLDRYSIEFNGLVAYQTGGAGTKTEADDKWDYPPIRVASFSSPLPDLTLEYTYEYRDPFLSAAELKQRNREFIDDLRRGQFAMSILVTRPPLTIMIVFLLSLIFISGGISMLFLYRAVLFRHRPATLSGLVWAASTAFTLIQTRGLLPSNPRSGIMLDTWIFYPSLVLCFLFAVLMFINWLSNDEWEIDEPTDAKSVLTQ